MKRPLDSSNPSFSAPRDESKLSSSRLSEKTFNRKRFWLIVAILALIEAVILFIALQWKYIFPSREVSDLYIHYENVDGVDVSFIKEYKVNDSVFVDVTLLEAKDSAGWETLKNDFEVPDLLPELQQSVNDGEDLILTRQIPKETTHTDIDTYPEDIIAISHLAKTLTLFHINCVDEKYAVLNHNYKNETIN